MRAFTRGLLKANDWSGNIRQLENVIKRYVIFGSEESILASLSDAEIALNVTSDISEPISLKKVTREATRQLERKVIFETLCACKWNRRETAKTLQISYRALLYKMKQSSLTSKRSSHPHLEVGHQ